MKVRILLGDCKTRMGELVPGSVGVVLVDPPYGLEFMGKAWDKIDWQDGGGMAKAGLGDRNIPWPSYSGTGAAGTANATCATCGGRMRGANVCACDTPDWRVKGEPLDINAASRRMALQQVWHAQWLREAFQVLKPGGVIKAFGGTRTFHRMAAAMEDVGFTDVRLETWGYGSGFPKSLDLSKALDKMHGAKRKTIRTPYTGNALLRSGGQNTRPWMEKALKLGYHEAPDKNPVSDDAKAWAGWGTGMKPAWEPVLVAVKPGGSLVCRTA